MELGLGIHGEAGADRVKLQPADKVVELMLKHMTRDDSGYQYFKVEPGMEVALVVNNLGGTSNLELSIVTNAAIRYLVDVLQAVVVRVYCGSLMTSLEMAGVSLTLLKLSAEWLAYLDTPTSAPDWPTVTVGLNESRTRVDPSPVPCKSDSSNTSEDERTKEPSTNIGRAMRSCVAAVCECLTSNEERLNDLDRGSGDGDCGTTLKAGSTAIQQKMGIINWDSPQQALLSLAGLVEQNMGGTSGALYTLFLTAAATADVSWSDPASWGTAMYSGLQAIMRYGRAERGHRTMIDALGPAVDVLVEGLQTANNHQDALLVLKSAVEAAREGAEATVSMKAKAGRASYVHTSRLVNPDPGAQAVALWMEAVYNCLKK
jgi:dihydroxyacetone kinase